MTQDAASRAAEKIETHLLNVGDSHKTWVPNLTPGFASIIRGAIDGVVASKDKRIAILETALSETILLADEAMKRANKAMTSPSAQKAAGAREAAKRIVHECVFQDGFVNDCFRLDYLESIIQQSNTEAVDAAVAPKEKRVKELEAEWRDGLPGMSDGEREIYTAFRKGCADELHRLLHPEDK